ncbi:MAG: hypothetical protein JNL06_19925 [Alphaproteobacteria bacterium]|nr:hypothetical protein [Alphaproteobacteria bacterium]
MRIALALGFVALSLASAVQAADRKIDDFYGRWIGTGQATQGVAKPVATQARDSEVIIEKAADGFKISWTTMSSDVADMSKSKVKTSYLTFKRGKSAGLFVDLKSGYALDGKKTTWARLSGDTLSISQLVIGDDGQWDVTVYDRTLKGADQMALAFTRITNGAIGRQASLAMTRAKD